MADNIKPKLVFYNEFADVNQSSVTQTEDKGTSTQESPPKLSRVGKFYRSVREKLSIGRKSGKENNVTKQESEGVSKENSPPKFSRAGEFCRSIRKRLSVRRQPENAAKIACEEPKETTENKPKLGFARGGTFSRSLQLRSSHRWQPRESIYANLDTTVMAIPEECSTPGSSVCGKFSRNVRERMPIRGIPKKTDRSLGETMRFHFLSSDEESPERVVTFRRDRSLSHRHSAAQKALIPLKRQIGRSRIEKFTAAGGIIKPL